jgi:hypothetical protein
MYEAGASCTTVAEHFGVTRQSMWDVLHRRTQMRPRERVGEENPFWRGGTRADDSAQNKLETAIKRGEIIRPDRCETCGAPCKPDAHHPDYGRPLDVMWLCQRCHHQWHRENVAKGVMHMGASDESISSSEAPRSPARTSASPAAGPGSTGSAAPSSGSSSESQMSLFGPADGSLSKTSPVYSVPVGDGISLPSSGRWPTSGFGIWPTAFWTRGSSEWPSGGGVSSSLPDVLEESVPQRYSLSPRAAQGILRRAQKRGRELPPALRVALESLAASQPGLGVDTTATPRTSS